MAPLERSLVWGDADAIIKGKEGAKAGEAVLRDGEPMINVDNWWHRETLGDSKYYAAYLQFFHKETTRLGVKAVFQRYVMDVEAVSSLA